jgi:hypothetical protein
MASDTIPPDRPYGIPPAPLMTPERARLIGRSYITVADSYRAAEMTEAAANAERQAQTWLAYALSLAATPQPDESSGREG